MAFSPEKTDKRESRESIEGESQKGQPDLDLKHEMPQKIRSEKVRPEKVRPEKVRLDEWLVHHNMAPSREKAKAYILAGAVLMNDSPALKPGLRVAPQAVIRFRSDFLKQQQIPYVSRAGIKLAAALDYFKIDVRGKVGLDIGASTGGFTDVLLQRGINHVYAVDVGVGQMDFRLRQDPRVMSLEKTNARYLTREQVKEPIGVLVMDVAFISQTKILPALVALLDPRGCQCVTLIKPQFELSASQVGKGGIVREKAFHDLAVKKVVSFAQQLGLEPHGILPSPIKGMTGNQEFLAYFSYQYQVDKSPSCLIAGSGA